MLLEDLRSHCAAAHEALHSHPLLAPLQGDISLPQYRRILAMFHAAYRPSETARPRAAFPDSPVLDWLESDFRLHGIAPERWQADPPPLSTESELAGYLYVKQGSTLGGQVISRHLEEKLGLAPGRQNHFFHGYGGQTGAHWRQFREQLADAEGRLDHAQVLASARRAFETIWDSADRMIKKQA